MSRADKAGGGTGRSQRTVERLYAAATELIAEVGWDNASSRLVAERAGVSLGVVHYHFDSIDELRRRAAVDLIERFFGAATQAAVGDPPDSGVATATDAIGRLLGALSAADPRQPELSVLYQSLVAAVRDEELRAELAVQIAAYRAFVEGWLAARGVENARSVAFTIIAAVDGYLIQRALDPELDPTPIADALARLAAGPREP